MAPLDAIDAQRFTFCFRCVFVFAAREVTWQRSADILSTGVDGRLVAGPERRRRVDMMRAAR
eukprot:7371681-Prymnesium_polylepis.1